MRKIGEEATAVEFALGGRLATVFYAREHVEVGGLVSYGIDLGAMYHRAAGFGRK